MPAAVLGSIAPVSVEDDSGFALSTDIDDAGLYEGDEAIGLVNSDRSAWISGALALVLTVAWSPAAAAMPEIGDLSEGPGCVL